MKKLLILLTIFALFCFCALQFIAIPKAQKSIEGYFQSAGFKNVIIDNASFNFNGLTIENVTLDKDQFNTAHNINAKIFWPNFILSSHIKSISIGTLKISSIADSLNDILSYKHHINADSFKNIAAQNLDIQKIIWDIATPKNALRIEGRFNVKQEDATKLIKADLNANQFELTLNSK